MVRCFSEGDISLKLAVRCFSEEDISPKLAVHCFTEGDICPTLAVHCFSEGDIVPTANVGKQGLYRKYQNKRSCCSGANIYIYLLVFSLTFLSSFLLFIGIDRLFKVVELSMQ